jgi:hypothetical protein
VKAGFSGLGSSSKAVEHSDQWETVPIGTMNFGQKMLAKCVAIIVWFHKPKFRKQERNSSM